MANPVYLSPQEVERIAQAATCVRDEVLVRVLFWAGCRVSEALGLDTDHVNQEQSTITIEHLKAHIKLVCPYCNTRLSRAARFCPGCGKEVPEPLRKEQEARRIRTIPLEKHTMDRLMYFIQKTDTKGLIFKITRFRALQIVKECAARAGIRSLTSPSTGKAKGVSPHRLRDAFATMVVQKDDSTDSIRLLQEMLGHANIGTTLKYRKVAGHELKTWYDKLGQTEDKKGK